MLPIVGVPETIRHGLAPYRHVVCRDAGCDQVRRERTGLLLRPHKPLHGRYALHVSGQERPPSRRARHAAGCDAGGAADALLPCHRQVVAPEPRGRGREVLRLEWTAAQPDRGPALWGVPGAGDQGEKRPSRAQPVGPAVRAHRAQIAGVAGGGQAPERQAEEVADWHETVRASSAHMAAGHGRLRELWPHRLPRRRETTRPERARERGPPLAQAGQCPQAPSACDQGGVARERPRCIARVGTPGGRARASARPLQGPGHWQRVAGGAAARRCAPPARLRPVTVRCRQGETQPGGACTTGGRLQRSGRQRLGLGHAPAGREDAPRVVLTAAWPWESRRVMATGSARWAAAILHACAKQVTGVEAAQGRQEDAVRRPLRGSGVAQSLLQRAPAAGANTDRGVCAQGETPCGQRCRTRARAVWHGVVQRVAQVLGQGRSCAQILAVLMPA
jgi:hypothetical protein